MTILTYIHRDNFVHRELELRLEVSIDPGQPGVSRLDPGRCEPEIPPCVDELTFAVTQVVLFDRSDRPQYRLSLKNGLLSVLSAEALAREFEARYFAEEDLQQEVDRFILEHTRHTGPED